MLIFQIESGKPAKNPLKSLLKAHKTNILSTFLLCAIALYMYVCYNIHIHERQGKTIMLFNPETFIIGFAQGIVAGSFLATIHILGYTHKWSDKEALLSGGASALFVFFLTEGIKQFF